MKKLIFVGLIAIMLLTACGAKSTAGPTEVKVMMWGSPEELAVWQSVADAFTAKNPRDEDQHGCGGLGFVLGETEHPVRCQHTPDLFAMDAPLFQDWFSRGALLNLQPYIDKSAGLLDGLYPVTLQAYQTPDGYFGVPRDCQTIALFYNKDMFDAAKLAYPDSSTGPWINYAKLPSLDPQRCRGCKMPIWLLSGPMGYGALLERSDLGLRRRDH